MSIAVKRGDSVVIEESRGAGGSPEIRFVMVFARLDSRDNVTAVRRGARDCVSRPLELEEIKGAVHRAFNEPAEPTAVAWQTVCVRPQL